MLDGRARKTPGHFVKADGAVVGVDFAITHPGYISWEQYMRNQKQLADNRTKHHGAAGGAAKRGSALLAGLLRCARCGRKLHVAYGGNGGKVARLPLLRRAISTTGWRSVCLLAVGEWNRE